MQTSTHVESYTTDLATGKLYQTRIVRQSLARVLRPLETEGIDTFSCGQNNQTSCTVQASEQAWFAAAAEEADVVSDIILQNSVLQVESAVFRDGNKWRFHDGASAFYAEVTDHAFISSVNAGTERFGKGDILIANLRRVQMMTDNGLKTEYTVEKVIEHRLPQQQPLL